MVQRKRRSNTASPRNELQRRIREIKNDWVIQKANDAERFFREKNHREFYATLSQVYGPTTKRSHAIQDKNGTLLTDQEKVKDGWVEHFTDLLNISNDIDELVLDELTQLPIDESLDEPITEKEIDTALKNTKLGKNPGPDGTLRFLLTLFAIFWATVQLPADLVNANISILFMCVAIIGEFRS